MKRFFFLIQVLLTLSGHFCVAAQGQSPTTVPVAAGNTTQAKLINNYPYIIILDHDSLSNQNSGQILEAREQIHLSDGSVNLSDSLFYNISRKVIFPKDKHIIPANSEFRREIEEELMPYMNNTSHVLKSIIIRGAASPEGPWQWNKTLSHLRMEALLRLITKNSTLPVNPELTIEEVPEDYIYLLRVMKESNDPDYSRVKAIVDRYFHSDQQKLKAELQALDHSALWWRLYHTYYPEMRAARVVLVFEKYDLGAGIDHPIETGDITRPYMPDIPAREVESLSFARRELISAKSNLLLDLAYMPGGYNRFCPIPNIALEYYPLHGHFTYGASLDFPWWQHFDGHKYFQIRNYQLEARYYLRSGDVAKVGYGNGAAFTGWYAQAYAHFGLYSLCFDAKRGWEGEGAGAGLGLGYVLPLTKKGHWRLELGAQFGLFYTGYDPYQWLDPVDPDMGKNEYYYLWTGKAEDFKLRQHRFTWMGPTRIGITLSYDLFYRNRKLR